MYKPLLPFTLLLIIFFGADAQTDVSPGHPQVITGRLIKITRQLRDYTPANKAIPDVKVRDEDGIIGKDEAFEEGAEQPLYPSSQVFNEDPALQKNYPNKSRVTMDRAITGNFNGIANQPLNPPDPSICAGPNHIIQMVNGSSGSLFKVYDKSGGQVVAQTYLDAITGKGGLGDPIALYDQLADRFVLTEFANKPETGTEGLIIAVSKTGDPAGSWYVYFFSMGTTFPDYPKFSVWPDAYYATTNDFASGVSYTGSSVYAFDRAKMLAGTPTAGMQKFVMGNANKFFSMSPVCLEGTTLPPAGTGGLIAYMQDDTWTSSTTDVDSIGILEFKVDFVNAANSKVTTRSSLATLAYKSDICTGTRGQCISQPSSTVKVEALHQKIMNQPVYRNFAGYEGIVLSHVVDKGSNIAGIRWYELRKTTGNWGIYQQSTYAPDNTNRWMPGICYDKFGNIGLAYNVSSSTTGVYPGARYTGRKACDALNTMTYFEDVIVAGAAANGSARYGDYSQLVCDPDGVTFWFTCEYNALSTWSTRIASFTLDPCVVPLCGDPAGLTTSSITYTGATISWAAVSSALSYDVDYKASASPVWINAATATALTSFDLTGLTQGTAYDWRVRATCAGGSGSYMARQFTTTAPLVCDPPTGLTANTITITGATVTWGAVSGAYNYDVEYKASSSSTWLPAATATTATSVNLTNLAASTLYDWRTRDNCSYGSSSYASAQFTTAAPVCPDQLEPNNTISTAVAITPGISYNAQIAFNGDNDYYSFNNTTAQKNIKVTLSNLPFNYDLKLYKPVNTLAVTSQNAGTTSETIVYNNTKVGTYKVYVYGNSGAYSSSKCYTLLVTLNAATFAPEGTNEEEADKVEIVRGGMKVYPVPASGTVTVSFDAYGKGTADIIITNQVGQEVMRRRTSVNDGINFNTIDVGSLGQGFYFVKVNNGKEIQTQKLVISR